MTSVLVPRQGLHELGHLFCLEGVRDHEAHLCYVPNAPGKSNLVALYMHRRDEFATVVYSNYYIFLRV